MNSNTYLYHSLEVGIVNINALAGKIKKDLSLEENKLTIAMAIRRLDIREIIISEINIKSILKTSTVTVEKNLIEIKINDTKTKIDLYYPYTLDILRGETQIGLVMKRKYLKRFTDVFEGECVYTNTNSISITFPPKYKEVHSMYYSLLREFSKREISIQSFRTIFDEIKMYFSNENIDLAYNLITELQK